MKKLIFLFYFILYSFPFVVKSQSCTSCTTTISTNTSSNLIVNVGDQLCILSGVTLTGNITLNGGTVCNEGTHTGNVMMNDGTYNNYGTIVGTGFNINHDKGTFNNYGTINVDNYTAVGTNIYVNNSGTIIVQYFDCDFASPGSITTVINNGQIDCINLIIDSTNFTNNNIINGTGNLTIGSGGHLINYGPVDFAGNFVGGNNGSVFTNCLIHIGGNWTNNSVITGPFTSCGGFTVDGFATNQSNGQLATDNSFIDVCEQGSPTGLSNLGTLGSNFTQCSCSNACSPLSIYELNDRENIKLFPNPATSFLTLKRMNSTITNYKIFSVYGQLMDENILNGRESSISVGLLSEGIYFIVIEDTVLRFIKK